MNCEMGVLTGARMCYTRFGGWKVDSRPVGRDAEIAEIWAACGDGESWAAIDQAIDDGLIERDGEVLRFTHPLLRSVLYAEMRLNQRRDAHQLLGATAEDIE